MPTSQSTSIPQPALAHSSAQGVATAAATLEEAAGMEGRRKGVRGVGGHGRARRQLLARSSEMKRPRLVRRVRRTLLAIESGGSGKTCKEAAAEVASYFFSSHDGCVGWRALAVIGNSESNFCPMATVVWEALPSARRSSVEPCRRKEVTAALILFEKDTAGDGIVEEVTGHEGDGRRRDNCSRPP